MAEKTCRWHELDEMGGSMRGTTFQEEGTAGTNSIVPFKEVEQVLAFFLFEVQEVGRDQIKSGSWLAKDLPWSKGPSQCCIGHWSGPREGLSVIKPANISVSFFRGGNKDQEHTVTQGDRVWI
jgi:hypothetical protein